MEILEYCGRLYEITVLGSVDDDALILECADMSAEGGLLFTVTRAKGGALNLKAVAPTFPLQLVQLVEAIAERELPPNVGKAKA